MLFQSYPYEPRVLQATDQRLERIMAAARKGLKGDTLALASGMLPTEYRALCAADPIAEFAEMLGRAQGEEAASQVVDDAIAAGDSKMALEKLKHQYGWVAKQQLSVEVDQRISITAALEDAKTRVIEGLTIDMDQQPTIHVKQLKRA